MTDNELIAEWLGYECEDDGMFCWYEWVSPDGQRVLSTYAWDVNIGLWHGDNGLLAEIDRRGVRQRFMYMLWNIAGVRESAMPDNGSDPVAWHFMQSTPAQLTAALVAVIKEENCDDWRD